MFFFKKKNRMLQLLKASRSDPDFYQDTTTLLTRYSSAWQVGLNHSRNKSEQTKTNQKTKKELSIEWTGATCTKLEPQSGRCRDPKRPNTSSVQQVVFNFRLFCQETKKRGAREQPRQAAPSETAGQCPGVGWLAGTHATTVWAASRVQTPDHPTGHAAPRNDVKAL